MAQDDTVTFKLLMTNRTTLHLKFLLSVLITNWDTCTLSGTMVQSVHVAYNRWGLMPQYPSIVFRL